MYKISQQGDDILAAIEKNLFFYKEISFCKVYSLESKAALEKLLLKNHISYFIEWGQTPLYQRVFQSHTREKNVYIFRINQADVKKAAMLAQHMDNIELVHPWPAAQNL